MMRRQARYTRRVSPLERLSLAVHEAHDYQVVLVVEGAGTIELGALERAVARAAAANPGIRVRLKGALTSLRWVDSGIAPVVRVIDGRGWDGTSERGAEFLREGLDPLRGGPIADVSVIHDPGPRSRLIFRGHHAAVDGRGLIHWVRDTFRALRGERLLGSGASVTDHDIREEYRARVVDPATPPPIDAIPIIPPGDQLTDDLGHRWRRVVIPRHSPRMLVETALFLAQWARRREPGKVVFRVPVDYRGLRTSVESVGNLIGYLQLVVDEGDTHRSLTRQLTQRLRDHEDCRPLPDLDALRWRPVRLNARRVRRRLAAGLHSPRAPSGGLVSMGHFDLTEADIPEMGFRAELAYGLPPPIGKMNVIIADYADHCVVVISVPASFDRAGELDELVEAYRTHFSGEPAPGV